MRTSNNDWFILPDASEVALRGCEFIKQAATKAIQSKDKFRIVLAGGTTPEIIYKMLSKENFDWSKWEFYLGDERCLPINSPERNSKMIMSTWLNHIDIPAENIHFIPAELGAKDAAKEYAETIKNNMPFDLVLLGMGEDGHTASLFPDHIFNEEELTHAVFDSPKPPSDRVSMSASSLSNAHQVLMIVTGASKKDSVKAWINGKELPIAQISALTKLTVLLDEAASSKQFLTRDSVLNNTLNEEP